MHHQQDHERIHGWGVDADPNQRPGVPRLGDPDRTPGAHHTEPPKQVPRHEKLKRESLDDLTHVFGTAQPPKLLSGMVRRLAYRIPEHRRKHWMLLLLADRVDVMEHRIRKHPALAALALVAIGGAVATRARLHS